MRGAGASGAILKAGAWWTNGTILPGPDGASLTAAGATGATGATLTAGATGAKLANGAGAGGGGRLNVSGAGTGARNCLSCLALLPPFLCFLTTFLT